MKNPVLNYLNTTKVIFFNTVQNINNSLVTESGEFVYTGSIINHELDIIIVYPWNQSMVGFKRLLGIVYSTSFTKEYDLITFFTIIALGIKNDISIQ